MSAHSINGIRIAGRLLLSMWIIFGLLITWHLLAGFEDYRRFLPPFFRGLWLTVSLVGISLFFGMLLSLPLTYLRTANSRALSGAAFCYINFFRGTPLIAQIFLVYYGFGSFREFLETVNLWWFFRDPFYCAALVFSMNTSAYQAEILRGAIANVPRGQSEAGHALGLAKHTTFFKVILPQALIVALRPYGNEVVLMIKGSAIASIITVLDLMGETRRAFSRSFDYNTYILAAIMYLIIVEILRRGWDRMDKRLTRHLVR